MSGMKHLKLVNKIINYSIEDFLKKTNLSLSNYGLPKKNQQNNGIKIKYHFVIFLKF